MRRCGSPALPGSTGACFAKPSMIPLSVTPTVMAVREDLRNYGAAQFEEPDWTIVGFLKSS